MGISCGFSNSRKNQKRKKNQKNLLILEAFKEGSLEDDSNSITRKKHEKLKVIRNEDTAEKNGPDSET